MSLLVLRIKQSIIGRKEIVFIKTFRGFKVVPAPLNQIVWKKKNTRI